MEDVPRSSKPGSLYPLVSGSGQKWWYCSSPGTGRHSMFLWERDHREMLKQYFGIPFEEKSIVRVSKTRANYRKKEELLMEESRENSQTVAMKPKDPDYLLPYQCQMWVQMWNVTVLRDVIVVRRCLVSRRLQISVTGMRTVLMCMRKNLPFRFLL